MAAKPPPLEFICGPHVDRMHDGQPRALVAAIDAARCQARDADFSMRAVSFFTGGPRERVLTVDDAEAADLRAYLAAAGLRAIAHGAYVDAPFRGDPTAAAFIRSEARVCIAAAVSGLVVHLPKLPAESVLKYAPRLVEPAAAGTDFRIYLETPATPGFTDYATVEGLSALMRSLEAAAPGRFGLCVDTAHLHTCGVDLGSYAAADAWFRGLEASLPAGVPTALHLNDSQRPRGHGPDRHEALMRGHIWSAWADRPAESGLAAAVDYARRAGAPAILERKPAALLRDDYRVLRELAPDAAAPEQGANLAAVQ